MPSRLKDPVARGLWVSEFARAPGLLGGLCSLQAMAFSGFVAQPVQPDPTFHYAGAPGHVVVQPEICMTWYVATGYVKQDKSQPEQQVLKLHELISFEGSTESKADPPKVSLNEPEFVIGGPSGPAWDLKEDVEEVLSTLSTLSEVAGACEVFSLASGLHRMAKLADENAYGAMGGLEHVLDDPRLESVVSVLRSKAQGLTTPRAIMQTIWALGKLGVKGYDVQAIIAQLAQTSPPVMHQWSSKELSNTLWGLARLSESLCGLRPEGLQLAYRVPRGRHEP